MARELAVTVKDGTRFRISLPLVFGVPRPLARNTDAPVPIPTHGAVTRIRGSGTHWGCGAAIRCRADPVGHEAGLRPFRRRAPWAFTDAYTDGSQSWGGGACEQAVLLR